MGVMIVKNVVSKKLTWIAAAVLLVALTACGAPDDMESAKPEIAEPAAISDDVISLENLDGWWYLADGYPSEGVALVQMFRLDAEAGTWTTYDQWGAEYYIDRAFVTDDGKLCLVFELGDAYFIPESNKALLDETGEAAFVKGGPPEENSSSASLDGKWYKNGDISAEYYLFEGSTYRKFSAYDTENPIGSGAYFLMEQEYQQEDESFTTGTSIKLDDPYNLDTLILSDDGTRFFLLYRDTFYTREDAIGTQ